MAESSDQQMKENIDETLMIPSESFQEKNNDHHHCCGCCHQKVSVNTHDHDHGSSSSSGSQPRCFKSLPIGWSFTPSDLDIVTYFLPMRIANQPMQLHCINEVMIYHKDPFQLLEEYKEDEVDGKWYFFTRRERKYKNGDRPRRDVRAPSSQGKWKIVGKSVEIHKAEGEPQIGVRRTLEFLKGSDKPEASNKRSKTTDKTKGSKRTKAVDKSRKTDIRMDEYVLETVSNKRDGDQPAKDGTASSSKRKQDEEPVVFHEWALCRIRLETTKVAEIPNQKLGTPVVSASAGEENLVPPVVSASAAEENTVPPAVSTSAAEENIVPAALSASAAEENIVPPAVSASAAEENIEVDFDRSTLDLNIPLQPAAQENQGQGPVI